MKYNVTATELAQAFLGVAQPIANVKGLQWKVWIHNGEEKSAGGIYLFEDEASVKGYLDSEIVSGLMKHPAVSDIEAKVFDVLLEHSKITRAPI